MSIEDVIENEEIEAVEEAIPDEVLAEDQDDSEAEGDTEGAEAEGDEPEGDEVDISFEGEAPEEGEAQAAPEWVRDLRRKNREAAKENRELKKRLEEIETSKAAKLGEKPTLESMDYDADKFEVALEQWHEQKRQHDARQAEQDAEREEQEKDWQNRLKEYNTQKKSLKVRDFEDAEASVEQTLSTTQQAIILKAADNPAALVYALGRNPKKSSEIAAIKDPVSFAAAVAKLENKLSMTPRKAPAKPEKSVSGSAGAGLGQAKLDALFKDAQKTGDFSKYQAAKRSVKKAS